MFISQYMGFDTNVSIDVYQTKAEAVACLSKKGAKAVGKSKMAFLERYVTVDQFLELATSGHTFCNLFDFDPDQQYMLETSHGMVPRFPVYKRGPNKGGMKLSFKSDRFFKGSHTIFVDVDYTRFQDVREYLTCLSIKPTCVYMSFSDGIEKHGVVSRRFRMVYVFHDLLDRDSFVRISRYLTWQIEQDTQEPMEDDCGTRISQYMNGVCGNNETYHTYYLYQLKDFADCAAPAELAVCAATDEEESEAELSVPAQTVTFNPQLLYDMQNLSYDEFMHRYSTQYVYFYRTEKAEWSPEGYQLTDDKYLQLWFYPVKQKDGEHRRRKLFKNACLRRLICPDVDADTLLFNLYIDLWRFFDNSDGVIQLTTLKRKVQNAMSKSPQELESYCSQDIAYWKANRPKFICKADSQATLADAHRFAKDIRYAEIEQQYDRNKSVQENIAAGLDVPQRTLYRFCHERGIPTNPAAESAKDQREASKTLRNKKQQLFIEHYYPDKSLEWNKLNLHEHGLDLSRATIQRWAKQFKDDCVNGKPITIDLPLFQFDGFGLHFTSDSPSSASEGRWGCW